MQGIFKSDFKVTKASARWICRLLSEDDCSHNQSSYNCKLFDVINNSNDVRWWVRHIRTSLFDIITSKLHGNGEKWNISQLKFDCNRPYSFLII